ncbi:hypothetical protein BLNAU_18500 [Blattamonas nauphoetae]|uniref:Uncharacterized protein n=1 Tax=Blattamonas nauphoetae TaxID=2049346 RepID=A0ABQ9X6Q6_9EUKA|nr:hypothetical protein BLNAU_18500 [Blattamonas nauphoetae]
MGCVASARQVSPPEKPSLKETSLRTFNNHLDFTITPELIDELSSLNKNFFSQIPILALDHHPMMYLKFFTFTILRSDSIDIKRILVQIFQKSLYGNEIHLPDEYIPISAFCCLLDWFSISDGDTCFECRNSIK